MKVTAKSPRIAGSFGVIARQRTETRKRPKAERLKMGERIRQLRIDSFRKQPYFADKLGVSLRMYQLIEEQGTTRWEHLQTLGKLHGIDPVWIATGKNRPRLAPSAAESITDQLDRIEGLLERILDVLEPVIASLHVAGDVPDSHQASRRDASQASATNSQKASRRKRASG